MLRNQFNHNIIPCKRNLTRRNEDLTIISRGCHLRDEGKAFPDSERRNMAPMWKGNGGGRRRRRKPHEFARLIGPKTTGFVIMCGLSATMCRF
eukprot:1328473-Amorphochlora_amoeboformis.AAC.2